MNYEDSSAGFSPLDSLTTEISIHLTEGNAKNIYHFSISSQKEATTDFKMKKLFQSIHGKLDNKKSSQPLAIIISGLAFFKYDFIEEQFSKIVSYINKFDCSGQVYILGLLQVDFRFNITFGNTKSINLGNFLGSVNNNFGLWYLNRLINLRLFQLTREQQILDERNQEVLSLMSDNNLSSSHNRTYENIMTSPSKNPVIYLQTVLQNIKSFLTTINNLLEKTFETSKYQLYTNKIMEIIMLKTDENNSPDIILAEFTHYWNGSLRNYLLGILQEKLTIQQYYEKDFNRILSFQNMQKYCIIDQKFTESLLNIDQSDIFCGNLNKNSFVHHHQMGQVPSFERCASNLTYGRNLKLSMNQKYQDFNKSCDNLFLVAKTGKVQDRTLSISTVTTSGNTPSSKLTNSNFQPEPNRIQNTPDIESKSQLNEFFQNQENKIEKYDPLNDMLSKLQTAVKGSNVLFESDNENEYEHENHNCMESNFETAISSSNRVVLKNYDDF